MMEIPQGALDIIRCLKSTGHEAYLVGGCVRDMVMHRTPKDFDIATSATPEQVKGIFQHVVLVGESFGVVRVRQPDGEFEVATFRQDGGYTDGRRPDSITFSTARDDVLRRDFTMNALLYDPFADRVIDHVDGQRDIDSGVIRAVGDPSLRFKEDRLRMLRAIRFAAQLGFDIKRTTMDAIKEHAASIVDVSKERITQELAKVWTSGAAGYGVALLRTTGMMDAILPASGGPQRGFDVVDCSTLSPTDREDVCWALLLSGMTETAADSMARARLRLTNRQLNRVLTLQSLVPLCDLPTMMGSARVVRVLISPQRDAFDTLQWALCVDPAAREAFEATRASLETPLPLDQIPRGIDMLEVFSGIKLGRALRIAEDAILERRVTTKAQAIELALREVLGDG